MISNIVITLASINWGVTHFTSFGDLLMRGIFLPSLLLFCLWGTIKTARDFRLMELVEYEDENSDSEEKSDDDNKKEDKAS